MSKTLKMVFLLEGNKTTTYSLAAPKESLTKTEVEAVMQRMIDKQAIIVNDLLPIGIKKASIHSTEEAALA